MLCIINQDTLNVCLACVGGGTGGLWLAMSGHCRIQSSVPPPCVPGGGPRAIGGIYCRVTLIFSVRYQSMLVVNIQTVVGCYKGSHWPVYIGVF